VCYSSIDLALNGLKRDLSLTFAWPFIAQGYNKYNVTQGPMASGWLDPCILGRYLTGVANDVFNGMEAVMFSRLATSHACTGRCRVVGPSDIVVVHRE
jgi:hypothetical protein